MGSSRGVRWVPVCLLVVAAARAGPVDRPFDPVVVEGASLPTLIGTPVDRIVAFRFDAGWQQLPLQVDEMAIVDWSQIYDGLIPPGRTVRTYTDASTFTGADPDPAFDADDELVWMAREMRTRAAGGADPAGVVPGSRVELRVWDPLTAGESWVYLFVSDGSLDPGMGGSVVTYAYNLLAGDYLTAFNVAAGPNREDSDVVTPYYRVHFSDRWIRDETAVKDGVLADVDLLDRHKSQFAPGDCQRTETTFSRGEGAFMANKAGPVRAIRAYVGANSGVTTHRVHRFYDRQEEIVTGLEVHPIPGVLDYFDYDPAASGMRYANNLNTGSVILVDGVPDTVQLGELAWEIVTGSRGTLAIAHAVDTTIPGFVIGSYYLDDANPTVTQCTGDDAAYGQSGPHRDTTIPNTDPSQGSAERLVTSRVVRYGPPDQTDAFAQLFHEEYARPLVVEVEPGGNPSLPGAPTNLRRVDRR